MKIYNITFIVESEIEQEWASYVDKELLPQISKNVHQIDLLKVEYIEGIQAVKGSTFSMQFYCVKSEHLEWIKNIGHQLVMQKLIRKFPKDWVAFATKLEFLKSY